MVQYTIPTFQNFNFRTFTNVLERSRTFVVDYRSQSFAIVPDRLFLLRDFYLEIFSNQKL